MLVLDALIAIACSDVPDEWARYCEIALRVIGNVPDAPRQMLTGARLRGFYTSSRLISGRPEVEEVHALEAIFLGRFVAAVHARRCSVRGFRRGELAATDVDPMLITVEAFRHIKGEQNWHLNGTTLFGVDVDMRPSPSRKLGNASDLQIHAEISAEYNDGLATGRKPPNVKEIGKLVQDRLRDKQLDASPRHIQELAGDPRYDGLRRKPGKTVASEQRG